MAGTFEIDAPPNLSNISTLHWVNNGFGLWTLIYPFVDNLAINTPFSGNTWSLDGGSPISFFSLPAGFTPLTAIAQVNVSSVFSAPPALVAHFTVSIGGFTFPLDQISLNLALAGTITALDLQNLAIIINGICNSNINQILNADAQVSIAQVVGTYAIQQSSFSPAIQNPTVPVRTGNKVVINSTVVGGINNGQSGTGLDGVAQIRLNYTHPIKGAQVITLLTYSGNQDPSLIINGVQYYWQDLIFVKKPPTLWFYLPPGFGDYTGPVIVTLIGNGIQFSGSVGVGIINVISSDGSGIYTLDKTKTSDTLYFRSGYTTDLRQIMSSFVEEIDNDDNNMYSMLSYPRRILELSDSDLDEDYEQELLMMIGALRIVVVSLSVEIPSPFIKTSFLP